MGAGTKSWPSVYIGINGVIPTVSPKSYRNCPRVNFGHEAGSLAIHRSCFPSSRFNLKNGKVNPAKLEPAANGATTISGKSPAFSLGLQAAWSVHGGCVNRWFV